MRRNLIGLVRRTIIAAKDNGPLEWICGTCGCANHGDNKLCAFCGQW
jgi:hypothetical protein